MLYSNNAHNFFSSFNIVLNFKINPVSYFKFWKLAEIKKENNKQLLIFETKN